MKKIKYILIFMISTSFLTSCFDDETGLELNDQGNNVAGFTNARENVSKIASGDEYQIALKMKLEGPTVMDLSTDITVTFAAAAGSTAIEGVHYRIDNPTTTLSKANNYLGYGQITMLTAGITAPLAGPSPVLVLMATATNGDNKVVASGKPVSVTLNYACDSNLDGRYSVVTLRDGGQISPYSTVDFVKTGVGEYRTSKVGHWGDIGGTPGFTFYDVCGVITVPKQDLVALYSNQVEGVLGQSSVDENTGIITITYTIKSTWESTYVTVYTPM
jgi:hypothetical protein